MSDAIQKALADLKARQEAGQHMVCPRCGRDTMKPDLYTNALSREADGIMVCDECGTQEALLAFMQNPMPVEDWAFLKEDVPSADFRDLPGKAVWEQIRLDHGPALIDIFKRWTQEEPGADFKAYRREAMRRCPGLTQIWEQPFQAMYEVTDGQLILRFRHTEEGVELTADLMDNGKLAPADLRAGRQSASRFFCACLRLVAGSALAVG